VPVSQGTESKPKENEKVKNAILKLYVMSQIMVQALKDESGQDLVEYAMVIAVVCLGVVSSMTTLASGINTAMSTVSTKLNAAVA
jgi:pilus assembly protein Flp/PilA